MKAGVHMPVAWEVAAGGSGVQGQAGLQKITKTTQTNTFFMWKICTTKQDSATKVRGWTLLPVKCLSLQPRYFAKEEMAQIRKVGVRANSNRAAIRKTED